MEMKNIVLDKSISLKDIMDVERMQKLMNYFYNLTGLGIGILDMQGNVLVACGWQRVCTEFHRVNKATLKNCVESDVFLGKSSVMGEVIAYKCKNGMWDIMTPIVIEGIQMGNICHGQFFYDTDEIDYEYFRRQARKYGFEEENYINAIKEVPIRRKETIEILMNYYSTMAHVVSEIGFKNIILFQKIKEIDHIAKHDYMTGLINRRGIMEILNDKIESSQKVALLLIDLNNFKKINDSRGHMAGDEVLRIFSKALKNSCDENSYISRIGGDEFLVIFDIENVSQDIFEIATKLKSKIRKIYLQNNEIINLENSIGVVLFPEHGETIEELMMNADLAMYHSKERLDHAPVLFTENMKDAFQRRLTIESILEHALKNNGFYLLYQPQHSIRENRISGFESLIRLSEHPISPAEFIPIAEYTGLIIPIGKWVIENVMKQIREWIDSGFEVLPVSINISPLQMEDATFKDFLSDSLRKYDVDPSLIHIEITESVIISSIEEAIEFISDIRKMGIKVEIDDFGKGYSSLSYLSILPVDKIKIDKSMSDRLYEFSYSNVMEKIISLCHCFDFEVLAEGIEEGEQLKLLIAAGCDYAQGYYFGKPMKNIECSKFLKKGLNRNSEEFKENVK